MSIPVVSCRNMSRINGLKTRNLRENFVSLQKEMKPRNDNLRMEQFKLQAYAKTALAQLYSPDNGPAAALQTLYRWMKRNTRLMEELNEVGYNKYRHTFLKQEVCIIVKYLGEP